MARLGRGTEQAPNEPRASDPRTTVVVEKVVEVVVEPRVVQVIDLPEATISASGVAVSEPSNRSVHIPDLEISMAPPPPMSSRARRASEAYQLLDVEPKKPLVIA